MDPKISSPSASPDLAANGHTLGQAHITVGLPTVTLVQYAPLPALCTEKNCGALGLTARALRKLVRSGLQHIRTPDGVTVLSDDLKTFCAQRAISIGADAEDAPMSADDDAGDDLDRLARAAGGRRGSRR